MKRILIVFVILITGSCYRIEPDELRVLILMPYDTQYGKEFQQEIEYLKGIWERSRAMAQEWPEYKNRMRDVFAKDPPNTQRMMNAQIELSASRNFSHQPSYDASSYLTSKFLPELPNSLILMSADTSSGKASDLERLAQKQNAQFVLNFTSIKVHQKSDSSTAEIHVQVYDNSEEEFLLNRTFTGSTHNSLCGSRRFNCALKFTMMKVMDEVFTTIASNSTAYQEKAILNIERSEELKTNYLTKPFDIQLLHEILVGPNSQLIPNFYQVLYNDDKTKFVAFSVQEEKAKISRELHNSYDAQLVDIASTGYFNNKTTTTKMPTYYGFLIAGVKYGDGWFLRKLEPTYMNAETLGEAKKKHIDVLLEQKFFSQNSTAFNSEFWNTGIFDETEDEFFQLWVSSKMKPVLDNIKNTDPWISEYSYENLFYRADKSAAFTIITFTFKDGLEMQRCFVIIKKSSEVLEWNYLREGKVAKSTASIDDQIMHQLLDLSSLEGGIDPFDNPEFWNTYVLLKEGDKYQYLEPVK